MQVCKQFIEQNKQYTNLDILVQKRTEFERSTKLHKYTLW